MRSVGIDRFASRVPPAATTLPDLSRAIACTKVLCVRSTFTPPLPKVASGLPLLAYCASIENDPLAGAAEPPEGTSSKKRARRKSSDDALVGRAEPATRIESEGPSVIASAELLDVPDSVMTTFPLLPNEVSSAPDGRKRARAMALPAKPPTT